MTYKIEESRLEIKTVKRVYEDVILHMSLVDSIKIDLTEVEVLDTSGIAVMLAWWQYAIGHNIDCQFEVSDAVQESFDAYQLKLP
jgi:ABC-type transporter Mla MlaB component